MFSTRFTKLLGIKYPIVQGALAWISRADLVAAVSEAGGLGSLTMAGMMGVEHLREEIKKIKALTNKPFAVNMPFLPGALSMTHEQTLEVILEEKVKAVETVGRIPPNILKSLKDNHVVIIHKVNHIKSAQIFEDQGVDAIVLIGFGAGGHPGRDEVTHFVLVPKAAKKLKVPILLGGNIADGAGFAAALALGADGVLIGTRFVLAEECHIHQRLRDQYLAAEELDTIVVNQLYGQPARRIKNKTALEIVELEKQGAPLEGIVKLLSGARGYKAWTEGDTDLGALGCGQVIGLIEDVLPAKQIIERIINEANDIVSRLYKVAKA